MSEGPLYFQLSTLLAAISAAWVFRISGRFLWSSVAPMQLGAWRRAALVFRVAHRKSSRFSSRASRQITGVFAWLGLVSIHGRGGCWIRTN